MNNDTQDLGNVEVASSSLNYLDKRLRSVNASAERVKISASNGNSFAVTDNNRITIVIAANQQNTFLDVMSSYLKLTVTNSTVDNAAAAAAVDLDGGRGAYGLFKQVEVLSGSSVISQINDYDCVIDQMASVSLNNEYREGMGQITQGFRKESEVYGGVQIGTGDDNSKVFCLPLYGLPIYQEKLIPLFGRSEIRINLYLNAASRALVVQDANDVPGATVSNPELVAYQVKVSNDVMEDLMEENDGKFEIMCQDIQTIPQTIAQTDRSVVSNLGFSFSSLNKISFAYYPDLTTKSVVKANRGKRFLTEYNLLVNGSKFPKNPVQVPDSGAEVLAELAIANKALADSKFEPSLDVAKYVADTPSGVDEDNTGQFIAQLDLEALREHSDTSLYSGLSTVGATTALQQTFSADGTGSNSLIVVGHFEKSMLLDMKGSQTFRISQ